MLVVLRMTMEHHMAEQQIRETKHWLRNVIAVALVYVCMASTALAAESCTITENTTLAFGGLQKPGSGSETYTIPADGGSPTGTGTLLYGTPIRGKYTLKKTGSGGGFTSITIDIQNVSTGNANVTLGSFTGDYNGSAVASFPATGLAKPATGAGTTHYLGATATYNSSAPVGSLTPSFDIVVTYQ